MKCIKTYAISFFLLALWYSVTGHSDVDHEEEADIFSPRIIGGRNAAPNERPFQVAIHWKGYDEHYCGGSIIDSEHVLTAGHCVSGMSPTELVVYAGVLKKPKESTEGTKVVRQVTAIFVHDGFVQKTLNNDIALLKVSPGFPTDNPAVKPIPLRKDVAPGGDKCTTSGWGYLGENENSTAPILQVAIAHLITYEECRSKYSGGIIKLGMICADKLQYRQGTCYGDSGGPLQCGGLLTGIVSGGGENCASTKHPDLYTDVAYYKEWIERHLIMSKGVCSAASNASPLLRDRVPILSTSLFFNMCGVLTVYLLKHG